MKFELPYVYLCCVCFLLPAAVFYTDPRVDWQWDTFLYGAMLFALVLAGFFLYRYLLALQTVRQMHAEETEPLSYEAEAYRLELQRLEREQIRELNDVRNRQQEHYNFIVTWFHEIKTPIAVLRLLQQTELDPRSVGEELERIERFVDQALYYAKLDSFNQDYEIHNCDLEPFVKELAIRHSATFITRKIRLSLQLEPTVVQSDPKWLAFIVDQLMTNSLKYARENGEISIAVRTTAQEKQLVVRDNGVGIAAMDLPRIFNRGFTGANGRTHARSTGMGLYLAQELSNRLGHYITCVSEAGSFTEMTVHFPRNIDPYRAVLSGAATASG